MAKKTRINWHKKPEADNYPSACAFLSLLYEEDVAARIVKRLKRADTVWHKAIDILRASREPLLDVTNSHVKEDHQMIVDGERLSPPLLVRDDRAARVIIADGYHRLCAVCSFDEDAEVPCRIVSAG